MMLLSPAHGHRAHICSQSWQRACDEIHGVDGVLAWFYSQLNELSAWRDTRNLDPGFSWFPGGAWQPFWEGSGCVGSRALDFPMEVPVSSQNHIMLPLFWPVVLCRAGVSRSRSWLQITSSSNMLENVLHQQVLEEAGATLSGHPVLEVEFQQSGAGMNWKSNKLMSISWSCRKPELPQESLSFNRLDLKSSSTEN